MSSFIFLSFTDFYKEQKAREKAQRFKEERNKQAEEMAGSVTAPLLAISVAGPPVVKVWQASHLTFFTLSRQYNLRHLSSWTLELNCIFLSISLSLFFSRFLSLILWHEWIAHPLPQLPLSPPSHVYIYPRWHLSCYRRVSFFFGTHFIYILFFFFYIHPTFLFEFSYKFLLFDLPMLLLIYLLFNLIITYLLVINKRHILVKKKTVHKWVTLCCPVSFSLSTSRIKYM